MKTQIQRIHPGGLAALIICSKLALLTTYGPVVIGAPPVRAPWLAAIIAGTAAFMMAMLASVLIDRFPGSSLPEVALKALGPVLGRLLTGTAAALFLYLIATNTRAMGEFMGDTTLRLTPIWALLALFLLPAVRAAYVGLGVISRLAKFVGLGTVASVLVLTALSLHHVDIRRIQPIFEGGIVPILHQAATPAGVFGEASWIVLLIWPLMGSGREVRRGVSLGLLVNVVLVGMSGTMLIALFGPATVWRLMYPSYSAAESIQIGRYLQRLEWIMVLFWISTMFVKVSVLMYGAVEMFAATLGLSRRVLLLPVGACAFVGAMVVFHDALEVWLNFRPDRFLPPELALELAVPVVLLVASSIRRTKIP